MALIGINPSRPKERKPSSLEKIALGLDIASKTLGIAFSVPEFLQKRKIASEELNASGEARKQREELFPLQKAQMVSDVGEKTEPAQAGEIGSFNVPGLGDRKPLPSLQRMIQGMTMAEKQRDLEIPTEEEYMTFGNITPGLDLETTKKLYPTRGELKDAYNKVLGATTIKVEDPFSREKFTYEKVKEGEKKEREKEERFVPSLGQYAISKKDADDTKSALATNKSIQRSVNELIELRKKYGGGNVTNREDVARAKQTATKLLLKYKNLETLGVLSKTDIALIDNLVPQNPLEMNPSGLVGQDPTMAKLQQLSNFIDDDIDTFLEARGFQSKPSKPYRDNKGVTKQEADNY